MPRNVLVTGAGRGIGAAVARSFGAMGERVVALDRCEDDAALDYPLATSAELDAVVRECSNGSLAVVADVADLAALRSALGAPEVMRDGFDAVVCAAGVVWGGPPVWETTAESWRAVIGANVTGVLNTAAVTIPAMLNTAVPRTGRFVAVASAAAERGLPRMGAYAASKAAVVTLVRSMAADLGGSGITANAVSPGSTDTAILDASAVIYGLGSPAEFARHHADPRLLAVDEVAAAVIWLCSAAASGVTGSVLAVDAGMSAT